MHIIRTYSAGVHVGTIKETSADPGECCMPGLHFPSECHTAADYERAQQWINDHLARQR